MCVAHNSAAVGPIWLILCAVKATSCAHILVYVSRSGAFKNIAKMSKNISTYGDIPIWVYAYALASQGLRELQRLPRPPIKHAFLAPIWTIIAVTYFFSENPMVALPGPNSW